jgi:hypothetical protein
MVFSPSSGGKMIRYKLFFLSLFASFALGAAMSTAASAEETFGIVEPKPTEKLPADFTSEGLITEFVSKAAGNPKIVCQKLTNTGEFTTATSGKITIKFKGCKLEAKKCSNNANAEEIELKNASIELVDFKKESKLTLGVVIAFSELSITCENVTVSIRVKNGVLGTIDEVTSGVATKKMKALYHQSAGEQEFKKCEILAGFCTGKEFSLEANFGTGVQLAGLFSEDTINFLENETIVF